MQGLSETMIASRSYETVRKALKYFRDTKKGRQIKDLAAVLFH